MWVRLAELANYKLGKTPDRNNLTFWDKDIPWVSIADMKEKETISTTKEKISEKAFVDVFSGNISPKGTLLMSFKLTVGRVSILGMDAEHNEAIISVFPYLNTNNITRDYLFYTLGELVNYCEKTDAIKGTTLNKEKMNKMLISVPPLQEQLRVTNKIREVEPYINKYDLFETELTTLEKELPDKLKKSVLQYAIRGKLVPQDPNDEPASVLLERIKAEKEQLIKEGKIKRDKDESMIYQGDDKNYYENLPRGWEYSTIKEASLFIKAGGDKPAGMSKNKTTNKCIPVIANGNKNNGIVGFTESSELDVSECITISARGTIGFPKFRDYSFVPIVRLIYLKPYKEINVLYLCIFLEASLLKGVGTSVQQLTVPMLNNKLIAIPPYNEQLKIIHKIQLVENSFNLLYNF